MKVSNLQKRKDIQGAQFVAPAVILMGIFIFFSVILVVLMSFCRVSLGGGMTCEFIGLENYKSLLTDPKVAIAFKNTFKFVLIVVPIQTMIALGIASLLHSGLVRGVNIFRTCYFLPSLTSTAVLSMLFMFLFSTIGPFNTMLVNSGLITEPIPFLDSEQYALPAVMIMCIWQGVPYFMMIFLSGMADIPHSLYESADLDGANNFQKWRLITMPQIKTTTAFIILTSIISSSQLFDQLFILSNGTGGPNYSTTSVVLLIYQNAFFNPGTMGYAAAISVFFGIIIFIIAFAVRKLQKNTDESIY